MGAISRLLKKLKWMKEMVSRLLKLLGGHG